MTPTEQEKSIIASLVAYNGTIKGQECKTGEIWCYFVANIKIRA